MKQTDKTGAGKTAVRHSEPMPKTTVTQVTPDDILNDGGPIPQVAEDGTLSKRQLEQDVVMTNPSVDSMGSRG